MSRSQAQRAVTLTTGTGRRARAEAAVEACLAEGEDAAVGRDQPSVMGRAYVTST